MDGPVVTAAKKALASGDVNLVLIWVQKEDEQEIRQAFDQALAVRSLSADAQVVADKYFFETLVRIHRAGEGAAFTGLKPAGRDLGRAIPLADQVLATGDVDPLVDLIADEIRRGLIEKHERAMRLQSYAPDDVEAGRAYVQSYVTFMHFVERAYEAATLPVGGHFPDEHGAIEEGHR
jgi:hypothetical protein